MPAVDGRAYKMVLVVRGELRLTAGKAAVQVAHAAVMLARRAQSKDRPALERWESEGQKKIALVANDLAEMQVLERKARSLGLPIVFVEDAGLTEVPPGTKTVLGLGPAKADVLDQVTGHLPLL